MRIQDRIIDLSLRFPKTVMVVVFVLFLGLGSLIPRIVIDTDPENMLPADQRFQASHDFRRPCVRIIAPEAGSVWLRSVSNTLLELRRLQQFQPPARSFHQIDQLLFDHLRVAVKDFAGSTEVNGFPAG